jgi:hypothetical protein
MDGLRASDVIARLVAHDGIRREAGNHRLDVMRVLRFEISLKNDREIECHGNPQIWLLGAQPSLRNSLKLMCAADSKAERNMHN